MPRPVDRRRFLGLAGASVGGLAVGAGLERALDGASSAAVPQAVVPFHGERQAGIITPTQDRLHIAAFDLVEGMTRADLQALLVDWTRAAEHMTAGRSVGPVAGAPLAPPQDTGEAEGLSAANLTVTFGVGPSLFDRSAVGLAGRRPAALRRLEALPGDELEPDRSDGDLCVQACADDPQVAFHAVRNLARIGRGIVVMRWSQLGFGKTARTSLSQATPRNLMGFKDGTNNLTSDEPEALSEHVWVGHEGGWLRGGTYTVCRRIRMRIEVWDRASLRDQQDTIGRHKDSGAPLGGRQEKDELDLARRGAGGEPVIPADAHVRHAAPASNDGVRLLRRGYSFTDGFDPETGQLDAGLFFISFQRDPGRFADVQRRLGSNDALNEYIKHTSSAVFAVPPGVRPGGAIGEGILRR